MAARAIWKGVLKIGSTTIPVKLYSAVKDRTVRFHILDDRHLLRVKQHMVDPETSDEVDKKEIQKGYELEPGRFVNYYRPRPRESQAKAFARHRDY